MAELPTISPTAATIGASAALIVGGVAGAAIARRSNKKSRRRKARSNSNSRSRVSRRKRGRRTPRTAGKRKDTSRRRIRYTKNGQPYVIGSNGKARFIKKTSAKRSHSQKGGRY